MSDIPKTPLAIKTFANFTELPEQSVDSIVNNDTVFLVGYDSTASTPKVRRVSIKNLLKTTEDKVSKEITDREAAITQVVSTVDSTVKTAIDKERATTGDYNSLGKQILTEKTRAEGVEANLGARITTAETNIASEITARQEAISDAITEQLDESADGTLGAKIKSEETRAIARENELDVKIDANTTAIENEVTNRNAAISGAIAATIEEERNENIAGTLASRIKSAEEDIVSNATEITYLKNQSTATEERLTRLETATYRVCGDPIVFDVTSEAVTATDVDLFDTTGWDYSSHPTLIQNTTDAESTITLPAQVVLDPLTLSLTTNPAEYNNGSGTMSIKLEAASVYVFEALQIKNRKCLSFKVSFPYVEEETTVVE